MVRYVQKYTTCVYKLREMYNSEEMIDSFLFVCLSCGSIYRSIALKKIAIALFTAFLIGLFDTQIYKHITIRYNHIFSI